MLPRLLLTLACCVALVPAAHAGRLAMACDVTSDRTGEKTRRVLSIDADRGVVRDNTMVFVDGATSPYAGDMEQFVQVEGGRATWGSRRKDNKASAGVFTLDVATGEYVFDTRFQGRINHGRCRPDDGTI